MKKRCCLTFIIQEIYNARFVPCHHKPSATLIVHTFLLRHATFDNAARTLPAHICAHAAAPSLDAPTRFD